ncbi:hypothetical protein OCU04_000542 [Sclerotinia nivalis]|uniref:Rhodopsin domain-containing protein n=1 Tax=Sclerotinia nivalis TaxID=352851 RepID=A0A9X0AWU2_9HELO|nr:hypothetical protein OCU04_000542 [Sclerotinia nivalis]
MEGIFVRQAIEGALPPPVGVTLNFVNPPSIAKYNVLCQIVCMPMITVFVCIRLYTRRFIHRKITGDDCGFSYIIWNGIIIMAPESINGTFQLQRSKSLERYAKETHEAKLIGLLMSRAKLVYVTQILYGPVVFTTKVTILLLLSRVFGVKENMLWAVRILIGLMALYYVPATAAKIFMCWPVAHFWDPLAIKSSCLNENSIYLADCVMSIISDFTILFLPTSLIWRLKTRTMRKIGVSAVFGAELALQVSCAFMKHFILVVPKIRLMAWCRFSSGGKLIFLSVITEYWLNYIHSIAEVNIGIICGCLPILPSFTKKTFSATPNSNDSTENSIYYRMERISKPKRNIDDSIMQTQTRPEDSNEWLTVGQSTIVLVNPGDNT